MPATSPAPGTAVPAIPAGEFRPSRDLPFSATLDELIAEIRRGRAPNLGRFCGYCCAPLGAQVTDCATCSTPVAARPPRDKISRRLARIYVEKRRREARIIHGAAWLGLLLGAAIAAGLLFVLPSWTKFLGLAFLIVGSYYIASYFGNVLAQNLAYRAGLRFFARRWQVYLREAAEASDD